MWVWLLHPADCLPLPSLCGLLRELAGRVSADGARHRVNDFHHCTVEVLSGTLSQILFSKGTCSFDYTGSSLSRFLYHKKHCLQFSGTMISCFRFLCCCCCCYWGREEKKEKQLQSTFIWDLSVFYLGLNVCIPRDNRNALCSSFISSQFWQLLPSIKGMLGHRSNLNC